MAANGSTGLIIFAHGSSVADANKAVQRTAEKAAERCGVAMWEAAFLELAEPDLETAVRSLKTRGAERIIVAPYFLTMGMHVKKDLPRILAGIRKRVPGVEVVETPPLDGHPALVDILADRTREFIPS